MDEPQPNQSPEPTAVGAVSSAIAVHAAVGGGSAFFVRPSMRYHDFHLEGYAVTKFGGEIVLELVWNYPDLPFERSRIRFTDVATYHFIHTGGAIITEIMETPFPDLLAEYGDQLAEWHRMYGIADWKDDRAKYIETLRQKGYAAWVIHSAIGFHGFVIARSVGEDISKNESSA